MFNYIFDLYQSLERFIGFENDDYADEGYVDDGYEYWESNKIILTIPIVSPIIVEPMLITSENTFVAKY